MKIEIPDDTVQAIRATGAEVSAFVQTAVSKALSVGRPAVVAEASRLARQLSPADRDRLRDDFNALRGVLVGSSIDEVCGDRHEGLR